MNKRTNKWANHTEIYWCAILVTTILCNSPCTCGSSTLYISICVHSTAHTHTFFAWKWKWMFDSCYIYNKLRFVSAFAISSTGFGTDTFLCSPLSLSHSISFIRRFLCPYTQCVNLLFLCFQTKNYPTASVIPCIREHVLCSHIYTRRNLMYNMLTDCFPSVIYFHSFWFFFWGCRHRRLHLVVGKSVFFFH